MSGNDCAAINKSNVLNKLANPSANPSANNAGDAQQDPLNWIRDPKTLGGWVQDTGTSFGFWEQEPQQAAAVNPRHASSRAPSPLGYGSK